MNPNSKIPALVDHSTKPATRVFESGSILIYRAERFGRFLPKEHHTRTETLSWLMWQMLIAAFPKEGLLTLNPTGLKVLSWMKTHSFRALFALPLGGAVVLSSSSSLTNTPPTCGVL